MLARAVLWPPRPQAELRPDLVDARVKVTALRRQLALALDQRGIRKDLEPAMQLSSLRGQCVLLVAECPEERREAAALVVHLASIGTKTPEVYVR